MKSLTTWFRSEETLRSFRHCLVCGESLAQVDTWIVSKQYHRDECVMEYAICEICRDQLTRKFSESSKQEIRNFLKQRIDWEKQMLRWITLQNPAERLVECVSCGMSHREVEGFTISAHCRGDGSFIEGALPLMVCSRCTQEMMVKLSLESLAVWYEFVARYFDGPDVEDFDLGIF